MSDGFAVDLTALVAASSNVDTTVRVLAQQSVTDLDPGGGVIGHAHLTDRLADFCERWNIGIGHLASDGRAIADRLRASAQAYEWADHAAAGRFAGVGPDPGSALMVAELGTTDDPTALVPGDAGALGSVVWWLQYYGDTLRSAGDGLRRIDTTDGWRGPAADAFRTVFNNQPDRWVDAGDAFHTAATGFDRYCTALTTAQQQAAQAIQWWSQGRAQSDAAQAQYDQQVRDSPVPVPVPFSDPGQALRDSAESLLAQARDAVRRAGDSAAATVDAATQKAPAKPGFWSKVGAVLDGVGNGLEHLGDDVLNGLASVGNAAVHHPGDLATMAAGLGLTVLSAGGEIGGVALDATGVGAIVGVPANVVSAAGIVTGGSMMMAGAADLGRHAAGDDAVSPASPDDAAPPDVSSGPGPNSSSDEQLMARRFGVSKKALGDAIHAVKEELGGSGRSGNPDVIVDLDTGEVYVKLPNGKASSDSIGNILDELPGE